MFLLHKAPLWYHDVFVLFGNARRFPDDLVWSFSAIEKLNLGWDGGENVGDKAGVVDLLFEGL